MFDVLDELIGPLNMHISTLLSQPISGTDDQRTHLDTKRAYLSLLNAIMTGRLDGVFTSERKSSGSDACEVTKWAIGNASSFLHLIETLLRLAEDISDPASQRTAITFLGRSVAVWGQPILQGPGGAKAQEGLPGFETFIYDRLVPAMFLVPSQPGFNAKDGQMTTVSCRISP